MVNFQPIPSEAIDMSEEYLADLSPNQKYLLKRYQALLSGLCEPKLASRKPRKTSRSHWLTIASRALRLYVSTENPSNYFML